MFRGKFKIQALTLTAAVFAVSACGGTTTLVSTPTPSPPDEVIEVVENSASDTVVVEEPAAESPDPTPTLGSRQQPAPVGSTALISDASGQPIWEIALLESELNVNDDVSEAKGPDDPIPDEFQYAAAKFSVTYVGQDKGFPSNLSIAFVTADGTTHKEADYWMSSKSRLINENELYQGGTAVGNAYIAIPTAGAAAGTWRISQFLNDSEFFFAAQ